MKKSLFASVFFLLCLSQSAFAGFPSIDPDVKTESPTFMLGIAVEFGDATNVPDIGFTAKVISSNRPKTVTFGGGISFYPWSKDQKFGADIGVGYNFNGIGTLAGYDFLRSKPQISIGFVPTEDGLYCGDIEYTQLINGKCYPVLPSDSRLKRDIQLVDVLDNGLKLYSFKYTWSDKQYVGVMAQDLLKDPRWADAVIVREDGYYAVDYDRLNLRMTSLEKWNENGRFAVARYVIHGDRILN